MKMRLLVILIIMLSAGCAKERAQAPYREPLAVAGKKIFVQVVAGDLEVARGLSGRERLSDSQGMLFDFRGRKNFRPAFWMKDMKFDLDLIWIREGKIIGVTEGVPAPRPGTPAGELARYYPTEDIDMVLEVNAGWSEKNQIKIGDDVRFKN